MFARTIANNLSEVHIPKGFRDHVINLAAQLYAQADGEEISAAISRQTGRPEAIIDWIITGHAIAEARARQTLRLALQEGISESDETAADVQAEPCRIRTPKRKAAQRERVA